MNSEWIPAGILPESTESSHSCEIPAEFRRNSRIPARFRRNSRIPAGISGGVKSSGRLHKICGQNEMAYLDNLCSTFIKENRQEDIESQISTLDKLQASIQKYENKIIFLEGIGSAYEVVNGIGKDVRKVLTNLEDIFCAALLGVEEVASLWAARKFLHQAEGKGG